MIIKEPITDGDGSRSFISFGLSDEEEDRERILRIMEISRRKKTNITRSTKMKKTKINKLRLLTEINIIKNKVSSSSSLEDAEKWKHEELAEEEKKPEMSEKTVALPSSRRWRRKNTPVKSW